MASISPCHGDDPGSIPGRGASFFVFFFIPRKGHGFELGRLALAGQAESNFCFILECFSTLLGTFDEIHFTPLIPSRANKTPPK